MTDHRFIDISEQGMQLRAASQRLRITPHTRCGDMGDGAVQDFTVPFEDLDAVILAHNEITATTPALAGLAKAGCGVIVCDDKRMPVGMMVPLTGHSSQTERLRAQAAATVPLRKRIWQSIIKAKIRNQGALLVDLNGDDAGLTAMATKVRSGDTDNREAHAAQRYWKQVFRHRTAPFFRNRDTEDENALLNYGYAVLRASTARALCGAGLHPGLGVHHHNRYDAYCLADDIMEPFRPLVDGVVAVHCLEHGGCTPVNTAFKQTLIMELGCSLDIDGERRTLFDVLARVSSGLAFIFLGKRSILPLPYIRSPLLESLLEKADAKGLEKPEPGKKERWPE